MSEVPEPEPLLVAEVAPGVRLLTLNRPAKRNAVDRRLFAALIDAFRTLDEDDDVRAAVLTGTGAAFCAGVDLDDVADAELLAERRRTGESPPRTLLGMQTPVIAAVDGACVAGGLELALACDFIIASDGATFADPHIQLGLLPSWGSAALLPLAVGLRTAKELALTGRRISAVEAHGLGLVTTVVGPEDLLPTAVERAKQIASAPPAKVRALLRIYDENERIVERMSRERDVLLESAIDVAGAVARREQLSGGTSR